MGSLEIPRERWASFFDLLSRHALERPVRLEVAGRELGDQQMSDLQPLRSLDLETKGAERGDLIILVGRDGDALSHRVEGPVRICIGHNEAGEMAWLAIEERDQAKTFLFFEDLPRLGRGFEEIAAGLS